MMVSIMKSPHSKIFARPASIFLSNIRGGLALSLVILTNLCLGFGQNIGRVPFSTAQGVAAQQQQLKDLIHTTENKNDLILRAPEEHMKAPQSQYHDIHKTSARETAIHISNLLEQ